MWAKRFLRAGGGRWRAYPQVGSLNRFDDQMGLGMSLKYVLVCAFTAGLLGCPEAEPTSPDVSQDIASDSVGNDQGGDTSHDSADTTDIGFDEGDSSVLDTHGDSDASDDVPDSSDTSDSDSGSAETTNLDAAETGQPCSTDEECPGINDCQTGSCDAVTSTCVIATLADGTSCTNPDPECVESALCSSGQCVTTKKASDCGAKVCGLDACNNSCGICPIGELCDLEDGTCTDPAAACMGVDFFGCCSGDETTAVYCLDGQLAEETCGVGAKCGYNSNPGWFECSTESEPVPIGTDYLCAGETCDKTCEGLECGTACGESCGTCPVDSYCTDAQACKSCGCDPAFECGQDPCGTSCGLCSAGSSCLDHVCVSDTPDDSPDTAPDAGNDAADGEDGINTDIDAGPDAD